MQWETDLVKDIRFFNISDDFDSVWQGNDYPALQPSLFPEMPRYNVTVLQKEGSDFSAANRQALREKLNVLKEQGKLNVILEIGAENNASGLTSTSEILRVKPDNCIYLAVDLRDLSQLNNPEKNIHTLQAYSQSWPAIHRKLDELGVDKIDFLFIDGWHSINQVLYDWEYTVRLADHGIVGFHDTAYHPGPFYFVNYLDKTKWNVVENAVSYEPNDYGVGFAWKK